MLEVIRAFSVECSVTWRPERAPEPIGRLSQGAYGSMIGQIAKLTAAIDALRIFEINSVITVTLKSFHSQSLPRKVVITRVPRKAF